MKKPERMKNKTTKAFLYQNLYPVNLYVTTLDDWEDACDFFLISFLVTWCVEQLEDFIECKRKEKRMIRKMTKQDGN